MSGPAKTVRSRLALAKQALADAKARRDASAIAHLHRDASDQIAARLNGSTFYG